MKKLNVLFLLLITIFSCSKDEQTSQKTIEGKWKLVQMSGSIPNSETTGTKMEWQESYIFNNDGTFKKSRQRNGIDTEIMGTYQLIDSNNEKIIELTYSKENEIIGSCQSKLKESMVFENENVFFSTWSYCDGPGLKYKK